MNSKITPKERGLIKGAIRRAFSRSELRKEALDSIRIDFVDENRPRVKKWGFCPLCKNNTPLYLMQVDHVDPVIPLNSSLEQMTWDEVIDRTWCDKNNLMAICITCHKAKSKIESKLRREIKKGKKTI